ncbi:PstS family phosphate ABC transporter substrate-binding protein [Niallia nealsonii]|uniref:PBP domain-containing protein n=1 Tax=Niallia nealsonii TaxID=115979 RepID=A0A2N0Z5E6_9BACI|nr:substrate-binding domain-containing protein [Niallia nealsonii]PKG24738.1 hypothetical protein CWS01_05675 [Niallia nealsonii]
MKSFGAILTVVIVGFAGFIATIIASLSRNAEFYVPMVLAITIGLIILILLAIYGQLKKKMPRISAIVFFSVSAVLIISYEGYQAYLKSLEVVSNQDVDLSEYRPFAKNTKAVSLEDNSTYKIKENLPMLDGATALYPVYSAFVQAVYPKQNYPLEESQVVSSQTSTAFDRLVNGDADIVFMAHPSENQMKSAKEQGVELKLTPIGREAFVFFVHDKNRVKKLSIKQIQGIYSGQIKNWKEVGGNDEKIRAFQRPEESGSQSALIRLMDGIPLMNPPSEDIVTGMGGIITETTNYRNKTNAIGFSFRKFSEEMVQNGKIKNIAVEGVLPTKENIQNEIYPIVAEFYAITAGSDNPHIEEFIKWIQSEQGQEIVEKTGYISLNN